jgi:hypothetical protein
LHSVERAVLQVLIDTPLLVEQPVGALSVQDADGLAIFVLDQDLGNLLPGAGILGDAIVAEDEVVTGAAGDALDGSAYLKDVQPRTNRYTGRLLSTARG